MSCSCYTKPCRCIPYVQPYKPWVWKPVKPSTTEPIPCQEPHDLEPLVESTPVKCPDCGTWWRGNEHRCYTGIKNGYTINNGVSFQY